mmetsp:Transcript_2996/g.9842  ORF Transcript_2996/g.9842 Transcript_2996/m.9842 type:complete len:1278 (+) Transcript_2996:47-3880(+)
MAGGSSPRASWSQQSSRDRPARPPSARHSNGRRDNGGAARHSNGRPRDNGAAHRRTAEAPLQSGGGAGDADVLSDLAFQDRFFSPRSSLLDRSGSILRVVTGGFRLLRTEDSIFGAQITGKTKLFPLLHFLSLLSDGHLNRSDHPLYELVEVVKDDDGNLSYERASHAFRQLVSYRRAMLRQVGLFYATASVALGLGFGLDESTVPVSPRSMLAFYALLLMAVTLGAAMHFGSFLAQMTLLGGVMAEVEGWQPRRQPNRMGVSYLLIALGAWTAGFCTCVMLLTIEAPFPVAATLALLVMGGTMVVFELMHAKTQRAYDLLIRGKPYAPATDEVRMRHATGTLEDANLDTVELSTFAFLVVFSGYQNLVGPLWEVMPGRTLLPGAFMVVASLLAIFGQVRLFDVVQDFSLRVDPLDEPVKPGTPTDSFCLLLLSAFSLSLGVYVSLLSVHMPATARFFTVLGVFVVIGLLETGRLLLKRLGQWTRRSPPPRTGERVLGAENVSREFRMLVLRRRQALEFLARFYIFIAIFFTRAASGSIPKPLLDGYFVCLAICAGVPSFLVAVRFARINAGLVCNAVYWSHLTEEEDGRRREFKSKAKYINRGGVSYLLFVLVTIMAAVCTGVVFRLALGSTFLAALAALVVAASVSFYADLAHTTMYRRAIARIRSEPRPVVHGPEHAGGASERDRLRRAVLSHKWGSLLDAHSDVAAIVLFAGTVIFTGSQIFTAFGGVERLLSDLHGQTVALSFARTLPALWGCATLLVSLVSLLVHRRLRRSIADFAKALDPQNIRGDSPKWSRISDLFLSKLLLGVMLILSVNLILFGWTPEWAMLIVDGVLLAGLVLWDRADEWQMASERARGPRPAPMLLDFGHLAVELSHLVERRRGVLRFLAMILLAMGLVFANVALGKLPSSVKRAEHTFVTTWALVLAVVLVILALRVSRLGCNVRVIGYYLEPLAEQRKELCDLVTGAAMGAGPTGLQTHLRPVHRTGTIVFHAIAFLSTLCAALFFGSAFARLFPQLDDGWLVALGMAGGVATWAGLVFADWFWVRRVAEKCRSVETDDGDGVKASRAQMVGYFTMIEGQANEDISAIIIFTLYFAAGSTLIYSAVANVDANIVPRDGDVLEHGAHLVLSIAVLVLGMLSLRAFEQTLTVIFRCTCLRDQRDTSRGKVLRNDKKIRFATVLLTFVESLGVFLVLTSWQAVGKWHTLSTEWFAGILALVVWVFELSIRWLGIRIFERQISGVARESDEQCADYCTLAVIPPFIASAGGRMAELA